MKIKIKVSIDVDSKAHGYRSRHVAEGLFEGKLKSIKVVNKIMEVVKAAEQKMQLDEVVVGRHVEMEEINEEGS